MIYKYFFPFCGLPFHSINCILLFTTVFPLNKVQFILFFFSFITCTLNFFFFFGERGREKEECMWGWRGRGNGRKRISSRFSAECWVPLSCPRTLRLWPGIKSRVRCSTESPKHPLPVLLMSYTINYYPKSNGVKIFCYLFY